MIVEDREHIANTPRDGISPRPAKTAVVVSLELDEADNRETLTIALPYKNTGHPSYKELCAIIPRLIAEAHTEISDRQSVSITDISVIANPQTAVLLENWSVALLDEANEIAHKARVHTAQFPDGAAFAAAWTITQRAINPLHDPVGFANAMTSLFPLLSAPTGIAIDPALSALSEIDHALRPMLAA